MTYNKEKWIGEIVQDVILGKAVDNKRVLLQIHEGTFINSRCCWKLACSSISGYFTLYKVG